MILDPDLRDEGSTREEFRGRELQAEGRASLRALR